MKRHRAISQIGILLTSVGLALATSSSRVSGEGETGTDEAAHSARSSLAEIRERAESMPIDARKETDKRIAITVGRVNNEAASKGQATMVSRLAGEFHTTHESLLDDKSEFGWSWGDLMIAHTLLANSGLKVTTRDLATLRSDGLGWGAIAYGLEFHLEDFEDLVKAEGHVAMGFSKSADQSTPGGK